MDKYKKNREESKYYEERRLFSKIIDKICKVLEVCTGLK